MLIIRDPMHDRRTPRGSVLSIGNFDGLHRGHQTILHEAVARARELAVPATAMTFHPHPIRLLRPRSAPLLLTTLEQKLQLIGRIGVDVALVMPFTRKLASVPAERFVTDVLAHELAVREVRIGAGFRFGADREGTVELLQSLGATLGFAALGATPVLDGELPISSTRIRTAMRDGEIGLANRLLGRPYALDGRVTVGARLGRTLGFPTLNIRPENEIIPATGVYVCLAFVPSLARAVPAVTNVGVRPTVSDEQQLSVETHLLDVTADLYGAEVRVFFLDRLRAEKRFSGREALAAQIEQDVNDARDWFDQHPDVNEDLVLPE